MELHLLITLVLFVVGVAMNEGGASASTVTSEMYWKSVLPDTPMPTAIKSSLQFIGKLGHRIPFRVSQEIVEFRTVYGYNHAPTPEEVENHKTKFGETFVLETRLVPGSVIEMRWAAQTDYKPAFLPSKVTSSIPFSSDKFPEILNRFSVDPKSTEALAMRSTIADCEQLHNPGEKRYCAASLEAMVSYAKSELGDRVNPVSSTRVLKSATFVDPVGKMNKYKITRVEKLADYGSSLTTAVLCHKEDYPYAVFLCHEIRMTDAYLVSLVSEGIDMKVAAVCHKDTSWWNPKSLGLQMLKVKPGTTIPVCHFLDDLSVVWTKK